MLPNYRYGQIFAVIGAIGIHSSLAAWAMMPSAPLVIPQQQVIQIAMVAPSSPAQVEPEPVQEQEPAPVIPPKPDGMKKAEPIQKPVIKKKQPVIQKKTEVKPKPKVNEPIKKTASRSTPITTGRQAENADQTQAALTDPIFNAAYLQNPSPQYPYAARRRGIEGKVILKVQVTPQGTAKHISIYHSSGSNILDEAAMDAVNHWKFVPARRGSEVVEANVLVPVAFKLN